MEASHPHNDVRAKVLEENAHDPEGLGQSVFEISQSENKVTDR